MILILPTDFEAHICRTALCQNFPNNNCIWKFAEQVGDLNSNVKNNKCIRCFLKKSISIRTHFNEQTNEQTNKKQTNKQQAN